LSNCLLSPVLTEVPQVGVELWLGDGWLSGGADGMYGGVGALYGRAGESVYLIPFAALEASPLSLLPSVSVRRRSSATAVAAPRHC
jgi:hypothetical protein